MLMSAYMYIDLLPNGRDEDRLEIRPHGGGTMTNTMGPRGVPAATAIDGKASPAGQDRSVSKHRRAALGERGVP